MKPPAAKCPAECSGNGEQNAGARDADCDPVVVAFNAVVPWLERAKPLASVAIAYDAEPPPAQRKPAATALARLSHGKFPCSDACAQLHCLTIRTRGMRRMRQARITIRLDAALLQRLEKMREEAPRSAGEKRRGGKVGLSSLVRRALESYLEWRARGIPANVFSASGYLLMADEAWQNPIAIGSYATLAEAVDAVPKGPFALGTPEADKAATLDRDGFSVLDCATLHVVWSGRYQTDLRQSPAVVFLAETWHDQAENAA